ncbi:hypothetical protein C8F04DRAFT_1192484 [Mycena alexandri]|uniref:Uncharacterized protein n=1 Tax=Mycena alexandri TaxID=1745969 RepID=A0AAD6SBB2_9AGAR|nr:hypothetical protein C8F04DRAFT_1192484 [Mycena alexandri]
MGRSPGSSAQTKERRREANRRYYETQAKKKYRRQWDPSKTFVDKDDDEISVNQVQQATPAPVDDEMLANETAAQEALRAMYRLHIVADSTPLQVVGNREPKSLAEIAAYESSREDGSSFSGALETVLDGGHASQLSPEVPNQSFARNRATLESNADAERAQGLRVIVESSRSWEEVVAIHRERGSVEVEKWLRGLE